jgi:hypothetical protein
MSRTRAASACLGVFAACVGCRREPVTPTPPAAEPAPELACASDRPRFSALDWVPDDTRLVALVEPGADGLAAAGEHLRAVAEGPRHGLPIVAAAELSQLGFETESLTVTLSLGGFAPGELLKLHAPGGVPVIVWPAVCDLDRVRAQVETAWGIDTRQTVDGVIGSGGEDGFPFDLLLLAGDRAAFVPRGRAIEVLAWLARAPAPTLTLGTGDAGVSPGRRVRELAQAPIRVVLQGDSLLAGAGEVPARVRTLRATVDGVEIDGRFVAAP